MAIEPGAPETSETSDTASWVDRHADALFRYALLQVRDRDLAEECVQETYLAALKARSGFRGESRERTWLVGILKHKICDHFRRRQRRSPADPEVAAAAEAAMFTSKGIWAAPLHRWSGKNAEEMLDRADLRQALDDCLSKLPPAMRDPFCLREMQSMPSDEICQALDLSTTNLWTLLHRARLLLRQCLETHGFGGGRRKSRGGKKP